MEHKRVTLFAGHYGSGKTNIAVNYALALKNSGVGVVIADLDIVNPYFRTKDSKAVLEASGIELISSAYANSGSDMPALPSELYGAVQRRDKCAVLDVGGDDRGALALGRFRPYIIGENDFEMFFVVNFYRPLTRLPGQALDVMREIEAACKMDFTGIINNSNLGAQTTAEDVLRSMQYASELGGLCGLPVKMTSAEAGLCPLLGGKAGALFPLTLQERIFDM